MITIKTIYKGNLQTEATHLQSGNTLLTDAPIDNGGKGAHFSPTDLVVTALGSCIVTLVGKAAVVHHIDVDGTRLEITKVMKAEPRRIDEIIIDIYLPLKNYSEKQQKIIKAAADNCPVALSLHPDIVQKLNFHF